ncbi:uncharacterized protein LOC124254831 [Haliotis rubra]|uniref:uncharacterized protein LOC124254831 n=1 Tax=Haliotis rubra TaxID=36100 RepID=UPI001EE61716|nr:uncharacterized protein LOC124254831 [Haliotis rubra]
MPTSSLPKETETTFQEISTTILTTQNTSPSSPEHPVTHYANVHNMTNVQTSSSSLLQPTDTDPGVFHSTGETTGSLETTDTETPGIYTETPSEHTDDSQYHTQDPNISTDIDSSNTTQHPGLDKTSIKYIALGASWGFIVIVFVVVSVVVRRQRAAKRRMVLDNDDSETLAADSAMINAETFVKATAYRSTDNIAMQNHAFSE